MDVFQLSVVVSNQITVTHNLQSRGCDVVNIPPMTTLHITLNLELVFTRQSIILHYFNAIRIQHHLRICFCLTRKFEVRTFRQMQTAAHAHTTQYGLSKTLMFRMLIPEGMEDIPSQKRNSPMH